MSKNCYGTQRTRHRAKALLTAHEVFAGAWAVHGGETGHGVAVENGTYHCDCGRQEGAQDGMCSHCLAVWLAIYGDFKKRKRQ